MDLPGTPGEPTITINELTVATDRYALLFRRASNDQ